MVDERTWGIILVSIFLGLILYFIYNFNIFSLEKNFLEGVKSFLRSLSP